MTEEDGGGTDEDGGSEDVDGGSGVCGSVASSSARFPDLPAGCVPRCTAATMTAVQECGANQSCVADALNFDGTPATRLETSRETQALDCLGCANWQQNGCLEELCPEQVAARWACLDANPGSAEACAEQTLALNNCSAALPAESLQECGNRRVRRCFP